MQDVPYHRARVQPASALDHALLMLRSLSPPMLAVGLFCGLSAAVLAMIVQRTGGASIYTLDDPYIHLALAERIALHGTYGINVGEFTSPSSSVIWPLLLLLGAGTPFHAWMPLLVALTFGAMAAGLMGGYAGALPMSPTDRWGHTKRLAVAGCLVLASNIVGLAFTGMEHTLQVLIAVIGALCVVAAWQGHRLPLWMLAVVALGPAVRYEMIAVVGAVALVLAGQRRWTAAIGLGLSSLVLPVLFSLYLLANGNYLFPNSIVTKALDRYSRHASSEGQGLLGEVGKLLQNYRVHMWPSILMAVLITSTLVLLTRCPPGLKRIVLIASLGVGVGHFAIGRLGWFYRYELYAVTFLTIVCLWAAFELKPRFWPLTMLLLGTLAGYYSLAIVKTPGGARNIYDQQYQMHRFVAEHYRKAVAVNDLGWVSFQIDPAIYVLDLWGLAHNEAARTYPKGAPWLDDFTRRHGVGLAIIYPQWFTSIPPSWTRVGEMQLSSERITPNYDRVVFFSTAIGDAGAIRANLAAFKTKLPQGVKLDIIAP